MMDVPAAQILSRSARPPAHRPAAPPVWNQWQQPSLQTTYQNYTPANGFQTNVFSPCPSGTHQQRVPVSSFVHTRVPAEVGREKKETVLQHELRSATDALRMLVHTSSLKNEQQIQLSLDRMNSMLEDTRANGRSDAKRLEESLSRKHQLATDDITDKVCHTIAKVLGDKSVVVQQNQEADKRLFTPAMPDGHIAPVAKRSSPLLCSRCISRVQKPRNNKSVSVRRYSIRPEWLTNKQEQKQATDKSPEIRKTAGLYKKACAIVI
jgi:hypothetical protein